MRPPVMSRRKRLAAATRSRAAGKPQTPRVICVKASATLGGRSSQPGAPRARRGPAPRGRATRVLQHGPDRRELPKGARSQSGTV